MVIIDTSVWLFALKKDFNPEIKKFVEKLLLNEDVAINGIIKLELLGGARSQKEYTRLKSRLDSLHFIDSDKKLWDESCRLAFSLKRKGISVPYTDIVIAASSILADTLLIHADRHFDLIKKYTKLKAESLIHLLKS